MGIYSDLVQKNNQPDQAEPKEHGVDVERPNDRTTERASASATDYPVERTAKPRRRKMRYSFEFFQDQTEALKEMQRTAMLQNEDFSMSAAVREALDQYLQTVKK